jgi:adenylyltransferase/sulfurtransferase
MTCILIEPQIKHADHQNTTLRSYTMECQWLSQSPVINHGHLVEQFQRKSTCSRTRKPAPFVNLFLGENNIRDLQGMETPLVDDSRLVLIPSIAGGVDPVLPGLTRAEILRYSRHLLIPEVGLEGQRRLKGSSVLVIGTGGLGSPVALYLAAAGVGRIGLVDYDVVDASNLQRQVIHGIAGIGRLKVESARQRLLDLNPDIEVEAYNEPFTSENAMRIAQGFDLLVDGTDNFPTRYLTNDVWFFSASRTIRFDLSL